MSIMKCFEATTLELCYITIHNTIDGPVLSPADIDIISNLTPAAARTSSEIKVFYMKPIEVTLTIIHELSVL